jgi:hypothetical protein|tara:strand:+ start:197 stop:322 length:126 start_codon:yes stop_codon:yes gene_type:complete
MAEEKKATAKKPAVKKGPTLEQRVEKMEEFLKAQLLYNKEG